MNSYIHQKNHFSNDHIIFAMKQKDLCDCDTRYIMCSGLMFDVIIMGTIRKNEFPHPTAETYCVFTQIDSNIIYMYRGSLQYFYWRKGTHECLEIPCVHFRLKNNDTKKLFDPRIKK